MPASSRSVVVEVGCVAT